MARHISYTEGFRKHGYSVNDVKGWRERELAAGRPSGLGRFCLAHGLCAECGGAGNFVIGVRWRDTEGVERAEAGPVAVLLQRHNLEKPVNWLNDTHKWDYLYERCAVCGGTGKSKGP